MTPDQLAKLGEFFGGFAVIASLVYLAVQIRQGNRQVVQNTKSLEASTHQAIIGEVNAFRALFIRDESLGRIYLQGLEDSSALAPGARAWWKQARYLYDSDFQRYIHALIAQHSSDLPELQDRGWA